MAQRKKRVHSGAIPASDRKGRYTPSNEPKKYFVIDAQFHYVPSEGFRKDTG